jgi:hypothetical protein
MEGMIMDSERFDGLVRSFGQTRSRRQTLRGLAGAGTLLALLAATPGEEAMAGERPHERLQDRTPQRNRQQRNKNDNKKNNNNKNDNNKKPSDGGGGGQLGSSQPGTGQNGQLGSTDSLLCGYQCNDALTDCEYACFNASSGSANPDPACYAVCLSENDACVAACPPE